MFAWHVFEYIYIVFTQLCNTSMFTFFYNQFSEASTYVIVIDHNNSNDFSIDFNKSRVYDILSNINPNKAMGPDKIHCPIIKICASPLSKPFCHIYLQKAIMVCPFLMSGK